LKVLYLHGLLDYLPGPGFVLVVGRWVRGGALDRGNPWTTTAAKTSTALQCPLFKVALRYTLPSPDLLVSDENPKLRLGWQRRSGVVPSVEAPFGDT
jgi:hypothetical protein